MPTDWRPQVALRILSLLAERKMDTWIFAAGDWRLRNPAGLNVAREIVTLEFGPTLVTSFEDVIDRNEKIVGVSNDHSLLARVASEAQALVGKRGRGRAISAPLSRHAPCHAALEIH